MRVWTVSALNLVGIETTLHQTDVEAYQNLVRNIGKYAGDKRFMAEAELLESELTSGVTEDLKRRINALAQRSGVRFEVKEHNAEWLLGAESELLAVS